MLASFYSLYDREDFGGSRNDAVLAGVVRILSRSPRHSRYPMDYIARVISPAIQHENLRLYFNSEGAPVAFVIWAFLGTQTGEKYKRRGLPFFHVSEWNEGEEFWIVDAVAPFGHFRRLICEIRNELHPEVYVINYLRSRNKRLLPRKFDRNKRSYVRGKGAGECACVCGSEKCTAKVRTVKVAGIS